ncbi:MAG: AAA family ATPase [Acidimicrobiales bacterium]
MAVLAAIVVAITVSILARPGGPSTTQVPLSTVVADLAHHRVASATLSPSASTVQVHLRSGAVVQSNLPPSYQGDLTKLAVADHVPLTVAPLAGGSRLVQAAIGDGPILLILILVGFLVRGRLPTFSGTKPAPAPDVAFADVAGADEAVAEVAEVAAFLSDPGPWEAVGARLPRGILLTGPPGVGKTLLAKALAHEAGAAFFGLSGPEFVEAFAGLGASRVRRTFAAARKAGRAVVFIDELDALGRRRADQHSSAGEAERDATLNQLLVEMDGLRQAPGVVVVGATNRPEGLDPALVRAGRLDRKVAMTLPDRGAREAILSLHAGRLPLGTDVDLAALAGPTLGMSGADLANLANEAAMAAARRGSAMVGQADFTEALATTRLGRPRLSATRSVREVAVAAHHEAGHAVAAWVLPEAPNPAWVSIIPRGSTGGATWATPGPDGLLSRAEGTARLVVLLAGREAEQLTLDGEVTQGGADDLAKAASLAGEMAARWGMAGPGPVVDEDLAKVAVAGLLEQAGAMATALVEEQAGTMAKVAEALMAESTLDAGRLAGLLAGPRHRAASDHDPDQDLLSMPGHPRGHHQPLLPGQGQA